MRSETDVTPESHTSDRFYFYVSVLVVPSILTVFLGLLLVNYVAALAQAANLGSFLGECIGLFLLCCLNFQLIIRLVLSLLAGESIQFVSLLLELRALLRLAGLL
jgi:hypothetical protein